MRHGKAELTLSVQNRDYAIRKKQITDKALLTEAEI